MADEVDVENALVGVIAAALYPSGTSGACAAGVPCKVFRGWPTPQAQTAAINGNFVNVSVATRNRVERATSRHPYGAYWQANPTHTLTASVFNNTITIGGTVSVPQNVVVLVGQQFVTSYAVQANDTMASIAAGLAALIAASFPGTTSAGSVVTVPTGRQITARIAGQGTVITETKRQEKSFQVSVWAPPCNVASSDADAWRAAVINVIDPILSSSPRILLPDQQYGYIHYERSITMDTAQAEGLYRRDLFYWVEYATTLQTPAYEIGSMQTQTQAASTAPDGTIVTFPTNPAPPVVDANS
jgi:hypothetical protein